MVMRWGLGALALAAALAAAPVRAGVNRVFEANGVFQDGVKLGGTLTIDVRVGEVTAAHLLLSEPISADVTRIAGTGEAGGGLVQTFTSPGPEHYPFIVLGFLTPSLVGYDGGPLASAAMPQGGGESAYIAAPGVGGVGLASGTLTVPEPSTWAMMLLGFAGLGYAGYRRRQKLGGAASV
jgi:hypothetical protein